MHEGAPRPQPSENEVIFEVSESSIVALRAYLADVPDIEERRGLFLSELSHSNPSLLYVVSRLGLEDDANNPSVHFFEGAAATYSLLSHKAHSHELEVPVLGTMHAYDFVNKISVYKAAGSDYLEERCKIHQFRNKDFMQALDEYSTAAFNRYGPEDKRRFMDGAITVYELLFDQYRLDILMKRQDPHNNFGVTSHEHGERILRDISSPETAIMASKLIEQCILSKN